MSEIKGLNEVVRKLEKLPQDTERSVQGVLVDSGNLIKNTVIDSIKFGGKSGKVYDWRRLKRGEQPDTLVEIRGRAILAKKRDTPHQASAPGQPPAQDEGDITGRLFVNSKKNMVEFVAKGKIFRLLEFGTRVVAARPSIFPAVEKHRKKIVGDVRKATSRAIKKVEK